MFLVTQDKLLSYNDFELKKTVQTVYSSVEKWSLYEQTPWTKLKRAGAISSTQAPRIYYVAGSAMHRLNHIYLLIIEGKQKESCSRVNTITPQYKLKGSQIWAEFQWVLLCYLVENVKTSSKFTQIRSSLLRVRKLVLQILRKNRGLGL